MGGEFYAGGVQRYQREGGSRQEKTVQFPAKTFGQKLEELRAGDAAEIARKYKFGQSVEALLSRHNQDTDALTEEVCVEFLKRNPEYTGYHPALVRAVAEELVIEKNAQESRESNLQ